MILQTYFRIVARFGILCCFFAGCTSSQKFKDYPRRQLDRPFTLLDGMSEGQVTVTSGYSKSASFYDISQPLPLNFYWIHAVSDRFSFIWFVLPLGFKYQLFRTADHTVGVQFFNQLGHPDDPNISPYLSLTDRVRFSESLEFQTELGTQSHILFKQSNINWVFSFLSGPRWQLHDSHMAHFWVGLLRELTPEQAAGSLSTGINYIWSVDAHYDLEVRVLQKLSGSRVSSVSDTLGSVSLKYIW